MSIPSLPRIDDERGVAALEFVIWVPILLIVLGLAVVGGRVAKADLELHSAVRAAARAASEQRSGPAAVTAAHQAAQVSLTSSGVTCSRYDLTLIPGGPGGVDRAQLQCVVPLGGIDFLGAGPSKTVSATATSPVDVFREFGS